MNYFENRAITGRSEQVYDREYCGSYSPNQNTVIKFQRFIQKRNCNKSLNNNYIYSTEDG
jgi:hypothetical protein